MALLVSEAALIVSVDLAAIPLTQPPKYLYGRHEPGFWGLEGT